MIPERVNDCSLDGDREGVSVLISVIDDEFVGVGSGAIVMVIVGDSIRD